MVVLYPYNRSFIGENIFSLRERDLLTFCNMKSLKNILKFCGAKSLKNLLQGSPWKILDSGFPIRKPRIIHGYYSQKVIERISRSLKQFQDLLRNILQKSKNFKAGLFPNDFYPSQKSKNIHRFWSEIFLKNLKIN